jgi:hypothetical protein
LHCQFIGDVNYNFQLFGDDFVIANTKAENLELSPTKAMIISICCDKIFIAFKKNRDILNACNFVSYEYFLTSFVCVGVCVCVSGNEDCPQGVSLDPAVFCSPGRTLAGVYAIGLSCPLSIIKYI